MGQVISTVATNDNALANVRAFPDLSSVILSQVEAGSVISLLGVNETGEWYRLQTSEGVVGWISHELITDTPCMDYLSRVDDNGYPLPTPTPTATPDPALCTGYAIEGPVHIRSGPSQDYPVIGTFGETATVNEVQVIGRYLSDTEAAIDDWLQVNTSISAGWVSVMWTDLEGQCFPMPTVDEHGVPNGGNWSPPTAAAYPPEAAELFAHSEEFRLPGPFDVIPVALGEFGSSYGYGANTFVFQNQSIYKNTHGYHTGIDFGGIVFDGRECLECINIYAICDGLIISRAPNTGVGNSIATRCAREDGSLSNIILSYDHLLPKANIEEAVFKGDELGQAFDPVDIPDWGPHLHLEVYYSVGFGNAQTAIRLNPAFLFASSIQHEIQFKTRLYYPVYVGINGYLELFESYPFDVNDMDDWDYGILAEIDTSGSSIIRNSLNRWLPAGDLRLSEDTTIMCSSGRYQSLFWSRNDEQCDGVQDLNTESAEWTDNTFGTIPELISALLFSH